MTKTILVVDDDQELQDLVSFALKRAGYDVRQPTRCNLDRIVTQNGSYVRLRIVAGAVAAESINVKYPGDNA